MHYKLYKHRIYIWSTEKLKKLINDKLVIKTMGNGKLLNGKYLCEYPISAMNSIGYQKLMSFGIPKATIIGNRNSDRKFIINKTINKLGINLGDLQFYSVRSIDKVENCQFYDITVENDHSMICNGMVAHNCYQEQLTAVWMKFGGLTAPEAEKARKAVAKKKRDEVLKLGPKIISGMIKNGFKDDPSKPDEEGKFPQSDPYSAQGYWSRMVDFGRYCFNLSHAMAYGIVAYRALWLKAHYPPEFWASILTYCKLESKPKYVSVAKAEGVNFRPLRVGMFSDRFTVDKDLNVYPSLSMVKGIGDSAAKNYSVDGGSCTSFDDFLVKYGKSKAVMERLIKLGAFDDIESNRNGLWNWYLYKYCSKSEDVDAVRKNINDKIIGVEWPADKIKIERERQLDEFKKLFPKKKPLKRITEWEPKIGYKYDYPTIKEVINLFDDYTLKEKLMFEKEYLGVYWTDPMQLFEYDREYCFENAKVEEDYYVDGIVEGFNDARTKNGKRFRNYNVSDGVETNAIKIWEDSIKYQDEEVYKPGCGVRVPVKWSEKYHSFSLQRNCSIVSLRNKRVTS